LKEFSCPLEASNWLKNGKILIHPTEGVWGLGCDAKNVQACKKINTLKQRDENKKFIILAPSLENALDYFEALSTEQITQLDNLWPGHITVIHTAKNIIYDHLKALDKTIGIRVSAHLPITKLLNEFSGPMVSTSANLSNKQTPNSRVDLYQIFQDEDVAIYNHNNGTAKKPSTILRLHNMEYLRE